MARRSASNARYRKDAQIGSTRRSSASMKPKRESGATATTSTSNTKKAKPPAYVDPPEVKKWRMWWAILLGVALVPVAYVLGPQLFKWMGAGSGWPVNKTAAQYGVYFEMAALAGALYIDFAIIRKIQLAAREAQAKSGSKKSEKGSE